MDAKKEKDLVAALRAKLASVDPKRKGTSWLLTQTPDTLLLRFLRGNKHDVEFAFEKMCETAKWRWEFGVDELMKRAEKDDSPATTLIRGHWPRGITGKDKLGRPVLYNHLTAVDFPGLVNAVGMDALELSTIVEMEEALRKYPEGGSIMVIDLGLDGMDKISFTEIRHWISTMVTYIKRLSAITDFYPEISSKIIFTRPPKLFYGTFKVTKTFLPDRTLEKIRVLSGDAISALLDEMDLSAIPDLLQGTSQVVLGLGGFLPKDPLSDQKFMAEMTERVKQMRGELSGKKERFSLIRSAKDEQDLQEKLALELLKEHIEMAKHKSMGAEKRGSWHFDAGLDVLDDTPDEVLIKELENENFDPEKALAKLKAQAAAKSGIKVPIEKSKSSTPATGVEDPDKKDKKDCVVM